MPATVFDKPMFPGAKLISSQITVTNTSGSYSQVITDERITAHMSAARVEVEDGTIFGGKITIAPANGSYTISCPSVSGSTTVKVFFLKTTDDPTIVTSAEFDILNNRMNALENADIRYSVTIPASGWTLSDGEYIYTWSNVMITSGAAVDVEFLEDDGDLDIESLEFEKVSGGVKFTSPFIPNDDIPVSIRVINARFNLESDITAEQVSTSAVSGASNVEEALNALNSKIPECEWLTSVRCDNSSYIEKTVNDISKYKYIYVMVSEDANGGGLLGLASIIIPTALFRMAQRYFQFPYMDGSNRWYYHIKYMSDTKIQLECTQNSTGYYMNVYGIK